MIPTVIVIGLAVGRWWAIVVAALAWPALLFATGVIDFEDSLFGAAALGAANAGVGVAVHRTIASLVQLTRRFVRRLSNRWEASRIGWQ